MRKNLKWLNAIATVLGLVVASCEPFLGTACDDPAALGCTAQFTVSLARLDRAAPGDVWFTLNIQDHPELSERLKLVPDPITVELRQGDIRIPLQVQSPPTSVLSVLIPHGTLAKSSNGPAKLGVTIQGRTVEVETRLYASSLLSNPLQSELGMNKWAGLIKSIKASIVLFESQTDANSKDCPTAAGTAVKTFSIFNFTNNQTAPPVLLGRQLSPHVCLATDCIGQTGPLRYYGICSGNKLGFYSSSSNVPQGFTMPTNTVTIQGAASLAKADASNDMIIVPDSGNKLRVYFGDDVSKPWSQSINFLTAVLASGDLDGDKLSDVVIWTGTQFKVYYQSTNKTFVYNDSLSKSLTTKLTGPLFLQSITAMTIGDLDQDGLGDLVFFGQNQVFSIPLLNKDEATLSSQILAPTSYLNGVQNLAIADLDSDGVNDLVLATSTEIYFFLNKPAVN